MKKLIAVLCLTLILVMTFSSAVFADGLTIVGVSPENGKTGLQPQNIAVKVKFSENMMDAAAIERNADKFVIVSEGGTVIPCTLTYNEKKYPDELWAIAESDLESQTKYTFTAKAGIESASGAVLAEDFTTEFHTRDVKKDSTISMVMTFILMGFMIFMTTRSAKNAKIKEDPVEAQKAVIAKMNPYKMSKEKGISLDEAKAEIAKEQEKLKKLEAKAAEEKAKRQQQKEEAMRKYQEQLEAEEEAARHDNNYQVKKAGSLNAHGHATPRAIVKANAKKRAAKEKAAKKAAKK